MSLSVAFHPEAEAEFDEAVFWYEDREVGVGRRFRDQVGAAIVASIRDPEAWRSWPDWNRNPVVRSKVVEDFPYRIVYFVHGDLLTIVAVAHSMRRPGYWRERMDE